MASANDVILDLEVRHQVQLWRYGSGVVSKMLTLLNQTDEDLIAQINKFDPNAVSGIYSQKRIEAMLAAIQKINRDAYTQFGKQIFGEMKDLADYEVKFQGKLIPKAIGIGWDIVQPSAQQLAAAVLSEPFEGKLLKDWVTGLEAGRYNRLRDQIRIGFVEGETTEKIVRRVRGTQALKYADGVLAIGRRSAEAMVRTAINHTTTASRDLLFQENDDLIKGVQWVSTLDMRTTPICQERDGKVYPLETRGPRPPAHINCRSTIIPITKSFKELGIDADEVPEGTRASMNGQVPAKTTYPEWLKQQSPEVQNDVLGPTKAQLWRDGGVTLDRFVDTTGKSYTIAQLRTREAAAFEKAGLVGAKPEPGPMDPDAIDMTGAFTTMSSSEFRREMQKNQYGTGSISNSHDKFPEFIDHYQSGRALENYVGSGYRGVNGYLRARGRGVPLRPDGGMDMPGLYPGSKPIPLGPRDVQKFEKEATEITDLMKANSHGMIVHRGIKDFDTNTLYKMNELQTGQTLDLEGFVSTSRDPNIAIGFAGGGQHGKNVLLQIKTRAGDQAVLTNPGEAELIWPDKSQCVVVKVHDVPKGHWLSDTSGIAKIIEANLVPRKPLP